MIPFFSNKEMRNNKEYIKEKFEKFEKIYSKKVKKNQGLINNQEIDEMIKKVVNTIEGSEKEKQVFESFLDMFIGILFNIQDFNVAKETAFSLININVADNY